MRLRPFNSEDAKTFHRWYHDPRLADFFRGFLYGASLDDCSRATDLMHGYVLLAEDEAGKPLGALTLAAADKVVRSYKLGLLVDPDEQHKGLAKKISQYGLEWAFNTANIHRIEARILVRNTRLNEGTKLAGFTYEGTLRETCYLNGQYLDEHVYSMLKKDYYGRK